MQAGSVCLQSDGLLFFNSESVIMIDYLKKKKKILLIDNNLRHN